MLVQLFSPGDSMRILVVVLFAVMTISSAVAQQNQSQNTTPESAKPVTSRKAKSKKEPTPASTVPPDKSTESGKPADPPKAESSEATDKDTHKEEHYDVAEVPPVITHHQVALNDKTLSYKATAGRLPIKRGDGKIDAEMFFVAYTLDGQEAGKRPVTFSFNGGPGSASVWLHMGALGPKRVVLQANGFMPAAPYRLEDNPNTLRDRRSCQEVSGCERRRTSFRRIHPPLHLPLRSLGLSALPSRGKLRHHARRRHRRVFGRSWHRFQWRDSALDGRGFPDA